MVSIRASSPEYNAGSGEVAKRGCCALNSIVVINDGRDVNHSGDGLKLCGGG